MQSEQHGQGQPPAVLLVAGSLQQSAAPAGLREAGGQWPELHVSHAGTRVQQPIGHIHVAGRL